MPEIVLAMRIELDVFPVELVATAASTTARGTVVHFFFFVGGGGVFVFVVVVVGRKKRGRRMKNAMTMLLYNYNGLWIKNVAHISIHL